MPETSRFIAVAAARVLAEAQADIGLSQFNALQSAADGMKKRQQPVDYLVLLRHAAPAAISLSLAAELLLKVAHFQSFGVYSHGHDLQQLCSRLPPERRETIAKKYLEFYSRDIPLAVANFSLADTKSNSNSSLIDFSTIDFALEHLKHTFESWRYIYESLEAQTNADINFKAFLSLIEAIHLEVDSYGGDTRIELGESTIVR